MRSWRLFGDQGEVTVTEVRSALSQTKDVARNTVQTMMVRLEEKGWLKHRERGRTFLYSAKVPRRSALGEKVSQMIDRMFAGSADQLMTALMEYRGLSNEEAERIQAMIAEAEAKSEPKSKRGKKS